MSVLPASALQPSRRDPSLDVEAAWSVLRGVLDPEVPVLSVVELAIVREVAQAADGAIAVTLTPTYSGCPATDVIAEAVCSALLDAGASYVIIRWQLAPPWTTDWLSQDAHDKLRRYGIAPPAFWVDAATGGAAASRPMRFRPRDIECPRCGSAEVEQLSAFGATACKALYRCVACREPFEYFKPF